MEHKLLSNSPVLELTENTDFLDILSKANLIKSFLIGSKQNADNFKMLSLYGNWGSGKSSLMKYLASSLESEFNTFFFEAWEYEKDENLAMSLLEFMTFETTDGSEAFHKEVLKYGGRILRGLGKSVKMNIPLFPNGPTIDIDPSSFVEEFSKNEEISFYEALKNFKVEFQRLEDNITREGKPKFNIVFIDDLDRCEPQQVLNLISAIKLFFTYGKKTIFFCGVDKSAVEAAVITKYGNIVKSNEYLEKVFDISFSMPDYFSVQKLINFYFDNQPYVIEQESQTINQRINIFFSNLELTNPRRIKKVLNKYQILREFVQIPTSEEHVFPNIDLKDGSERGFFETILVLYLIILHEFYPEDFSDFLNFEKKKDIYIKVNGGNEGVITQLKDFINSNLAGEPFSNILQQYNSSHQAKFSTETRFFVCLSPFKIERITTGALQPRKITEITVKEKHIDYLFYKYISSFDLIYLLEKSNNNMTIIGIKQLIRNLL